VYGYVPRMCVIYVYLCNVALVRNSVHELAHVTTPCSKLCHKKDKGVTEFTVLTEKVGH
jgi:hypothetical protein